MEGTFLGRGWYWGAVLDAGDCRTDVGRMLFCRDT